MGNSDLPLGALPPAEADVIAQSVAAISRIDAVPSLLRVICASTGMGFAAVARVDDTSWTACAVQDDIGFGLKPGGQLELRTTLCFESRNTRQPIIIDQASADPEYCEHHTPRIYNIESYISVPIVLPASGEYFGNLCAIDPRPAKLKSGAAREMFVAFAELIALHLENDRRREQAESALLNAQALADLREQFIAVLGHDLRNPLAALGATSAVIERSSQEVRVQELAQRMGRSVSRMSHLISDVMDLARARLGSGLGVNLATLDDLATALQLAVEELSVAYPERELQVEIDVPRPVKGDKERLQQLLSNLVANALTHGSSSHPIQVRAVVVEEQLVIEVLNHGEPIAEQDLPNLLMPYWRPVTSSPGGGLGLGLYICSQIVKGHKGELTVTSSRQSGTLFRVTIPLQ